MPLLTRRFRSVWIATAALMVAAGLLTVGPRSRPAIAQTCRQSVLNPDFEEGAAGWETASTSGSAIIIPEAAFHGQYGARLGGVDHADDRLWQAIFLPENSSSISLTFFYRIETSDGTNPPADHLAVQLIDQQDQVLVELTGLDNQSVRGQWFRRVTFFELEDPATVAGQNVRFQLRTTTDGSEPTTFFIDDIDLLVCGGGRPAVSDLRMKASMEGPARDHFNDETDEIFITFDYANIREDDEIRLLVRDHNGTALLDHTYKHLFGGGTERVTLTARDAVDGLVRSGLDAGNNVILNVESALQADSRFRMIPYVEQAIVSSAVLQNAVTTLRKFAVSTEADAYLAQAQDQINAALEAGQGALSPTHDLAGSQALAETMRDEIRAAMVTVAEARATIDDESLVFPNTVNCLFNLTNVYLNKGPVDSIEWTVGASGPPARIHPPQDARRAGTLHVHPLVIYTQGVVAAEAPHIATITGRVADANCRPVADGTEVRLSLDDPSVGLLPSRSVVTSGGYFTATLETTNDLGDGSVAVHAQSGDVEGVAVVFLVGPPATVDVDAVASSVSTGYSTRIVVQVRDARGRAVADGTEVDFRVSPPDAGSITPDRATTANGFASASFRAGGTAGLATIRITAGNAEGVAVIEIAEPAFTPTPAPTSTPTPAATSTPTPTPGPTATPACDSSDPEQLCNGIISVRVFEDPRCDGLFNNGVDRPIFGVPVSLVYPDATSVRSRTDPGGYTLFNQVHMHGDERIAILVEYPEELVMSGLTPCDNSGTLKFLDRGDLGAFGTAAVMFRAYRQIVVRRGILQVAQASVCFSASYYLEPTDGGPVVYLVTNQDLSDYLDSEIEVTGSTWEIELCQYLLPVSIELVP